MSNPIPDEQQQLVVTRTDTSNDSRVDSILGSSENGSRNELGIQGIMCNDVSGFCLESHGLPIDGTAEITSNDKNSGIYSSLVRLAYQLEGNHSIDDTEQLETTMTTSSNTNTSLSSSPLITIEMEPFNILVKEYYDGYTVAMRVPSRLDTKPPIRQRNGGGMNTNATQLHPNFEIPKY